MRVFKYPLQSNPGSMTLELPKGYRILCVKEQHGQIVLYVLVNQNMQFEKVFIDLLMTGQEMWSAGEYIGTIGETFVLHIFKSK